MAQVRRTSQAAADIEAICLFIARDAPQVAATDRLAEYPRLGRVVPELHNRDIREIIITSFRVLYQIRDDDAQVLTIHHGALPLDTTRFGPVG